MSIRGLLAFVTLIALSGPSYAEGGGSGCKSTESEGLWESDAVLMFVTGFKFGYMFGSIDSNLDRKLTDPEKMAWAVQATDNRILLLWLREECLLQPTLDLNTALASAIRRRRNDLMIKGISSFEDVDEHPTPSLEKEK